eukprot:TRINITY_DN262_c0_g1_i1.p1 TRINITY_DN262_c0_g1~~TRINITY_DN262_c0_g1_i1.p1  ORF type:complete len:1255 (+),score=271.83 TRINITY_DN262_c0_g1_i1:3-3767(+)
MLVAALFLAAAVAWPSVSCPHLSTDLTAWSVQFPTTNPYDDLTIPAGVNVILSSSNVLPLLHSITVHGRLVFADDGDINLDLFHMYVSPTGGLHLGSATCPLTSGKIIITIHGNRTLSNTIGIEPTDSGSFGTKGLAFCSGSVVEMHGSTTGLTWTVLAATAQAGATQLTLRDVPTGWHTGDQIVITTTDFQGVYAPDQTEYHTIVATSGNTLTIANPLRYMKWSDQYEKAEIGLLTRNIVVRGDDSSMDDGFGGHFMMRAVATAHISSVEFTRMGQRGVLGRYPVHFHLMDDARGKDISVTNCAIHHVFQRCLVLHDSSGVLVQNNVAANTTGHCYFLEDGGEMYNTFIGNLAADSAPVPAGSPVQLLPTDDRPAMFWITNPYNTYRNNYASGGTFGFWFALPVRPNGLSINKYANTSLVYPRLLPLLEFSGNHAHSAMQTGLHIDDMQNADQTTSLASFTPKVGPYNPTKQSWEYVASPGFVEGFTAWKCRNHGIWMRVSSVGIRDAVVLDCTTGMNLVPGPSLIDGALVIGESDNIGTVEPISWLPNPGRSRPVAYTNSYPIRGIESYDSGGPQLWRNIEFRNFVSNQYRSSGAFGALRNGQNMLYPENRMIDVTFTNANQVLFENFPNAITAQAMRDGPKGLNFQDLDGSVTGWIGGWIVGDKFPIMVYDGCVFVSAWNAYKCPLSPNPYVRVRIENDNLLATNWGTSITAPDQPFQRIMFYDMTDTQKAKGLSLSGGDFDALYRDRYEANLRLHQAYTVRWPHPSIPQLTVSLGGAGYGDWVIVAIPYPAGTTFTITDRYNLVWTSAASLETITWGKYYFNADDDHLYLFVTNPETDSTYDWEGFSINNGGWGSAVIVTASCGASCTLSPTDPPIPKTASQILERVSYFRADLSTADKVDHGQIFFQYDELTHMVTYQLNHDLASPIGAQIRLGSSTASVWYNLPIALNSARGGFAVSRDKYISMLTGDWYITISSASVSISGRVGCDCGACAKPNPLANVDPCVPAVPNIPVFDDTLTGVPFQSWSWGLTNMGFTAQPLCFATALTFTTDDGALNLHYSNPPLVVDLASIKAVEFYARLVSPLDESHPFTLAISLKDNSNVQTPTVAITAQYVANWVIESTWTRVRVPLSALGLGNSGSYNLRDITVFQYQSWTQPNRTIEMDAFRLVSDVKESTSAWSGNIHKSDGKSDSVCPSTTKKGGSGGSNAGAIAGGVIGAVAGVGAAAGAAVFYRRRRNSQNGDTPLKPTI